MKPKRNYIRGTRLFGTALRYGTPVWIGFTVMVTGLTGEAAIFGAASGGGQAGAAHAGTPTAGGTPASVTATRDSVSQILNRTNTAVGAARALQQAARAAAAASVKNSLGTVAKPLPNVPNGLVAGGLQVAPGVATDPAKWSGAKLPTQTIATDGTTKVTVQQTSQQALLNWQTFNVGKETTLTFDQSAGGTNVSQWIAFNKISDPTGNPSQILGSIKADGQVYVINSNGIIFGGGSQVNAHNFTASTLPINDNLVTLGLLNNPDSQFLFSALPLASGIKGTPAFTPDAPLTADGRIGDIVVQAGARISSPTTADHIGGRVALIGANVTNQGTLSTPDGQTILAAGLQVAFNAHATSDASLRGLDVYVGAVTDPASNLTPYAGTASNQGIINISRANATITGKTVNQCGVIDSTTSVSLNGRVDLLGEYNAVGNAGYDPSNSSTGLPFVLAATGMVDLGPGSVTRILPEWDSTTTVIGATLALPSQMRLEGQVIHLEGQSSVFAPNANITVNSGTWDYNSSPSTPRSTFVFSGGQIYLDSNSEINVAGSTDVAASVSENVVAVQLRGAELADSPVLREGALRGMTLYVDAAATGVYDPGQWAGTPLAGKTWVGTPLANVAGYVGLIQRTVGELTTAGGSVNLASGGSVVLGTGATIDVSGGWTNYQGGIVQTSRVSYGNDLIDVSQAYPNLNYNGIVTGITQQTNVKWNITDTTTAPFLTGTRYQDGYISGGNGGSLNISAPAVALDGRLLGNTTTGQRQRTLMPTLASFSLAMQGQQLLAPLYPYNSPTPPVIVFQTDAAQTPADPFRLDANGNPNPLRDDRTSKVVLSTALVGTSGFGNLTVYNPDSDIVVAAGEALATAPGGSISLSGANVNVAGTVRAAGGNLYLTAYNISPTVANELKNSTSAQTPAPSPGRGLITLASSGVLDVAGLQVDDRAASSAPLSLPLVTRGGTITVNGYDTELATGSVINASGGVAIDAKGAISYGNGGAIALAGGQDASISSVLGGHLLLGADLMAYSGGTGGSLGLSAPAISIGSGVLANADILSVDAAFFSEGGFNSFSLAGMGLTHGATTTPGIAIASGTIIQPVVTGWLADPVRIAAGLPGLSQFVRPAGVRSPVSLSFTARGAKDLFTGLLLVRGDTVLGANAVIRVEPGGNISFKGDTVAIAGAVFAPGGSISVTGGKNFASLDPNPANAFVTVDLLSGSVLSAAGAELLTPDPYGRRTGRIFAGGSVNVNGNIAAESGATIDVSGASGTLDLVPGNLGLASATPGASATGVSSPLGIAAIPTTVSSNGGSIILTGQQELFCDATLIGRSGGSGALGGSISISSGRFYASGTPTPADITLQVSQHGPVIPGAFHPAGQAGVGKVVADTIGNALPEMGYFAADTFTSSGCDSLTLAGNISFHGAVTVQAASNLTIATGGVLAADSAVALTATHISIGTAFQGPLLPQDLQNPFLLGGQPYYIKPTTGGGSLTAKADLIDIGNLSLQSIGSASFIASNGDIRGNGTLDAQGDLLLKAGQIYPPTDVSFQIVAYDSGSGSSLHQGTVTIESDGSRQLPLSAAGRLSIYATTITQGGVLRAPFGSITLGWDGTGTAPADYVAGPGMTMPTAADVTLQAGSITSVSAADPTSGQALTIPYGLVYNGNAWITPSGLDITSGGLLAKGVYLAGASVSTLAGSKIDISGGGDLYAYHWVQGLGGSTDILASNRSFAVIPGYAFDYAPAGAYHASSATDSLGGDAGYVNSALSAGDKVYLQASNGLAAGNYTLLPARYALLPGAFLVTPVTGTAVGQVAQADKSTIVSGYRFNDLNQAVVPQQLYSRFDVASGAVVRNRAQYDNFSANTFLKQGSVNAGGQSPRLPIDAAQLALAARISMEANGFVTSSAPAGGRGGQVDLSSPLDILIAVPGTAPVVNTLVLDATQLTSFGAQSLLIGGIRQTTAAGTTVSVASNHVTVDNQGAPLTGPDITLVANQSISFAAGADVESHGVLTGAADLLLLGNAATGGSGDGVLVRVSSDSSAAISRANVSGSSVPLLSVAAGASIIGTGVIIDSSARTSLDSLAVVRADTASFSSGQISIQLDNPGPLWDSGSGISQGLVLSGTALHNLQTSARNLSLTSYSSLDIYGSGRIGDVGGNGIPLADGFSLHAGEIRGFNTAGGTVTFAAKTITLGNTNASSSVGSATPATGTLDFDAQTIRLGRNSLAVDQYQNVVMNSSGGVIAAESGSISVSGALTIAAPMITTAKGVSSWWTAAGLLDLQPGAVGSLTTVSPGLGGTLNLQGSAVTAASHLSLPGGKINLDATAGDLHISGLIDVGGYSQTFGDVVKYVDGGEIGLFSAMGNVDVLSGGTLRVAAAAGGGDAGTLVVRAHGSMVVDGTMAGTGGSGGTGGTFTLDVGTLTTTASLDSALDLADFSASRSIRVRNGDVVMDGTATTRTYSLTADQGAITVSGIIAPPASAAGSQNTSAGGSIILIANGGVTLMSGSKLDVSGAQFNDAGKGGSIDIEAGASYNGIAGSGSVDIQTGSVLDLSIAAATTTSAAAGQFSGTLHLRAPQNQAGSDLMVNPIRGTITGASKIEVEGYRIYDLTDFGGLITSTVQSTITGNAANFLGTPGNPSAGYQPMITRLSGGNSGLASSLLVMPGVEIINRAMPSQLGYNLNTVGSSLSLPSTGGSIVFPSGTPGSDKISVSTAGTITSAAGVITSLLANTPTSLAAGSTVTLATAGSVSFASGSDGKITVGLTPNSTYTTTGTGTSGTISAEGSMVSLNTAGTSSMSLAAGSRITFPSGTAGTNKIKSSVTGSIISPTGTVTALAANTSTAIPAGSAVVLSNVGTISFASGGTGGAIPVALAAGNITPSGPVTMTPVSGNLVLGGTTSTSTSDWNLSNARFGPMGTAGTLTMRATGNLVLYNTLSDGFTGSAYTSALAAPNPLLPANAQSWSFRLTAGADLAAVNFHTVQALANIGSNSGSLQLGKNGGFLTATGGASAKTSAVVPNLFQVIRTGSGDITISAGRDVRLLNQFATIYTAGTLITAPTLGGTFQAPTPNFIGYQAGSLGGVQQTTAYPVHYAMAGGNVDIYAQEDIIHLTLDKQGKPVADSEREMPENWLYRRGYVDPATGTFGVSNYGDTTSTTWWVDYSNFFEGVGALGGGNVTLHAGRDVSNVDAVAPTNARMPSGTPTQSALVEMGGGDVIVNAGRNIDAGVYYVERGKGTLTAGNAILTNSTRSPSMTTFNTPSDVRDRAAWLPTTLFLGKGSFDVTSGGDLLLGPVANAFLLPQGYNNTYWYKSYFSTYAPSDSINVTSLGGSITFRESVTLPATGSSVPAATPVLLAWFQRELLLSQNPMSASYLQPWLRLAEASVTPFATAASLLPPTLKATAYSGDINLVGNLTLAPAAAGTLDLLANGALNGVQANGVTTLNGSSVRVWGSSTVNLSDANPALLFSTTTPFAYQSLVGTTPSANTTESDFLSSLDALFAETGSTNGSLQTKQGLHTPGTLHAGDADPLRLYAGTGDISGLTLYSAKPALITAGQDLRDIAFYIQNTSALSVSMVGSGRDIIAYDANSPLLVEARSTGNALNGGNGQQSGDIQISGPGTLEILAGRNLDLGIGAGNANGTGTGITSIGNARNPYLDFNGAAITAAAGVGDSFAAAGHPDFSSFITQYVKAGDGTAHLTELGYTQASFEALDAEHKDLVALQVFYLVLRDAGRDHSNPAKPGYKNYNSGTAAIATLFPGSGWNGNISTQNRDIRTKNGGDISLLAPGGGLSLVSTTSGNSLAPPGIITEAGGRISIFTKDNVSLGIARIFTLRGGDEIIWSSVGNIAAGSSSKTVQSAPPTRVLIDPQSADVKTDLAGLATGGGIGVLASVAGVAPGNIDLIAPVGTIDAGDAGIRVSGNLNISAAVVVNASNISAGGTSTGTAPSSVSAPSVSSISAASTTAAATNAAAESAAKQQEQPPPAPAPEPLSIITVEVIGYGGGAEGDEEQDEKRDQDT